MHVFTTFSLMNLFVSKEAILETKTTFKDSVLGTSNIDM